MPFGMDIQTKPYQKVSRSYNSLSHTHTHTHSFVLICSFQPVSVADMKVATTVFVGNITEKATDSLVRQILLVSSISYYNDLLTPPILALWLYCWLETSSKCYREITR